MKISLYAVLSGDNYYMSTGIDSDKPVPVELYEKQIGKKNLKFIKYKTTNDMEYAKELMEGVHSYFEGCLLMAKDSLEDIITCIDTIKNCK